MARITSIPSRQVIMRCSQEKWRGQKRAARNADTTLPPPKRRRPPKPTGIRGRLSSGGTELEKKLERLCRAGKDNNADDGDHNDDEVEE